MYRQRNKELKIVDKIARIAVHAEREVAFATGTVMGFMVVGLGLAGVSIMWLILQARTLPTSEPA